MWLKLASPPSTSIQGTLYTICRVQQRLQQLNMPHQLAPPLASTAKTAPFQPVAPCPSFSKYPRKSHSAFKPETQRPRLFDPGGTPLRGCLLHGATLERLCDCVLACRVVSRGRVPLYAVIAGDVTVHDRGRVASASVVHGRAWPSCLWPWCRVRRGRGAVVFVSPSCGCDTPMNASVSNGFTS